jgi:hypothetical protein
LGPEVRTSNTIPRVHELGIPQRRRPRVA